MSCFVPEGCEVPCAEREAQWWQPVDTSDMALSSAKKYLRMTDFSFLRGDGCCKLDKVRYKKPMYDFTRNIYAGLGLFQKFPLSSPQVNHIIQL